MKKTISLLMTLCILMSMLLLTGCTSTARIDVSPYLSLRLSGYSGSGTAVFDFDFADFEYSVMSEWSEKERNWENLGLLTALETTITCQPARLEGLKNGDSVTVTLSYDEEAAKKAGVSLNGTQKTFTVEGLPEAVMIDPFAEDIFSLSFEGIAPFALLEMGYTGSSTAPEAYITYRADKEFGFSNGDTVTVTATMSDRLTQQGYLLTRSEMTFTAEGLQSHVTDASRLTAEDEDALQQKVLAFFEQQAQNGITLCTADGYEFTVTPDNMSGYTTPDFTGTALTALENNWWDNTADVIIPYRAGVADAAFYWWKGDFCDLQLVMSFPSYWGYTSINGLVLDESGALIREGSMTLNQSPLFETEEAMRAHLAERYPSALLTESALSH